MTQFNAGSAFNVCPESAELRGTLRCFVPETRATMKRRIADIATQTAAAFGATVEMQLFECYPATVNDAGAASRARAIAQRVVGEANVVEPKPTVASEDFACMLQAKPGCYLWLGNGSDACREMLHQAR